MTAMLSGVIMIAAFGLVAAAGLILVVSLARISGRGGGGSGDPDRANPARADPEGG